MKTTPVFGVEVPSVSHRSRQSVRIDDIIMLRVNLDVLQMSLATNRSKIRRSE